MTRQQGERLAQSEPLLDVRHLKVGFRLPHGVAWAVDDISFRVGWGESLGIVGESGSGKSVSMLALLRLLPPSSRADISGKVFLNGRDLLSLDDESLRRVRGREIAMIFQDPLSSLNPVLTIGEQIEESLRLHHRLAKRAARERAMELLAMVGIPDPKNRIDAYPFQFSGGMRQRVMIAMALAGEPKLLIADEPTTALDVTIQLQILDLIARLREEMGMALVMISHDLGVVAATCERLQVMYAGKIVEEGPTSRVLTAPAHPYTTGLIRCLPPLEGPRTRPLNTIPGQPAQATDRFGGCRFHTRCPSAQALCANEEPSLAEVDAADHRAACWLVQEEVVPQ